MSLVTIQHFNNIKNALDSVKQEWITKTVEAIKEAPLVLIGGNGGSAAIAIHLAADLRSLGYRAIDLLSPSKLTQIGNDQGFDSIFSRQIDLFPDALCTSSITS